MAIEFDIDVDVDEIKEKMIDAVEEQFIEHVENELGDGGFECENCEARSFDVETWQTSSGDYGIGAVCRECNERLNVDIDTSKLDEMR